MVLDVLILLHVLAAGRWPVVRASLIGYCSCIDTDPDSYSSSMTRRTTRMHPIH